MRYLRYILLLTIIFNISEATTLNSNTINVTLTTDKTQYIQYEPIVVKLVIENLTPDTICYEDRNNSRLKIHKMNSFQHLKFIPSQYYYYCPYKIAPNTKKIFYYDLFEYGEKKLLGLRYIKTGKYKISIPRKNIRYKTNPIIHFTNAIININEICNRDLQIFKEFMFINNSTTYSKDFKNKKMSEIIRKYPNNPVYEKMLFEYSTVYYSRFDFDEDCICSIKDDTTTSRLFMFSEKYPNSSYNGLSMTVLYSLIDNKKDFNLLLDIVNKNKDKRIMQDFSDYEWNINNNDSLQYNNEETVLMKWEGTAFNSNYEIKCYSSDCNNKHLSKSWSDLTYKDEYIQYPDSALVNNIRGDVEITFTINDSCKVGNILESREVPIGYGFGNNAINWIYLNRWQWDDVGDNIKTIRFEFIPSE